jgi:ABC-type nitrate/sulfonate/bicarbonate transport system substrate-binding protein
MTLKLTAARTLAAAPFILLADSLPEKYQLAFFSDHDAAMTNLINCEVDVLCTGFTEASRAGDNVKILATYVWGLSAMLVHDSQFRDVSSLAAAAGHELLLPFAGSPLDLQVRAILRKVDPAHRIKILNADISENLKRFQQKVDSAIVLPEPLATALCDAGKARRLGGIAGLWAAAFGELMTPQVSCLIRRDAQISEEFAADIKKAITRLVTGDANATQGIADAIGQSNETVLRALPHVIFALPAAADAERLESHYRKILDSL